MSVGRLKLPLSLVALPVLGLAVWSLAAAGPGQAKPPAAGQAKPEAAPQPAPAAEYVGSETCSGCHADFAADKLVYHKEIDVVKRLSEWKGRACESCHGPGKAHAESADPKLIFSFKGAPAAKASQTCLKCHAQGLRSSGRAFDAHARNSVGCGSCHTVHAPKAKPLLAGVPNSLCVTCHSNVKAEFFRPYRHRLAEGAITCTDCHNPHGAPGGGRTTAQSRASYGNEQPCLKCHADKRGPFTFEHLPVRTEGCSACHEPHGSVNPRLLTRHEVRFLCLECHTTPGLGLPRGARPSGTAPMGQTPPAFHDLRSPRYRNCTTCHIQSHGSYMSQIFER